MIGLVLALALAQADGGTAEPYRGAEPALRASFELADGGIVALPALPDGGVVAVVLTPAKAMELADERQKKDWELAEAKKPQPVSTVAIIVGAVKLVLDAVPVVVSVIGAARQP